ncbi:hypothetical protein N7465_000830 [Penicillium sp. CMV-2018d]|nr:hypothetical protein N7465_000830 [Penicillium sp. CMV-2018d]
MVYPLLHTGYAIKFTQSRQIWVAVYQCKQLARTRLKSRVICKLVEGWLWDERRGKWVCILDNVDDQLLCSGPAPGKGNETRGPTNANKRLDKAPIRISRNISIIIMSRARETALEMADHAGLIEVKPMERAEALELLQRKLEQPRESQESQ